MTGVLLRPLSKTLATTAGCSGLKMETKALQTDDARVSDSFWTRVIEYS